MSFLCQKDSFLKEFQCGVKSCLPSKLTLNGKSVDGYDVVLEDTIFFPEGGGQPYDIGTLGPKEVINVRRDGGQAVLFIKSDGDSGTSVFDVGEQPLQKIDWNRRFDHMQHHSGQHLISAVAMNEFNLPTTSWSLGVDICNIEFGATEISEQTLEQLEISVNQKIRDCLPVTVTYRERDDLSDIRAHLEIPPDHTGLVRIVSIDELDKNTCCGTHVTNLSQLQAIKLLGTQKGKKGKSLIFFLAGNRLLNYFGNNLKREKALTTALKCPNDEIVGMMEKLQKTIKRLQKNSLSAMRDLGKIEAEKYLQMAEKPTFYSIHRKEGEFDFISIFINTVGDSINDHNLILISVADDCLVPNCAGQIMLAGNEQLVQKSSEIASRLFGAKGSVARNKFRARVPDVSKLSKLEEQIRKDVLS